MQCGLVQVRRDFVWLGKREWGCGPGLGVGVGFAPQLEQGMGNVCHSSVRGVGALHDGSVQGMGGSSLWLGAGEGDVHLSTRDRGIQTTAQCKGQGHMRHSSVWVTAGSCAMAQLRGLGTFAVAWSRDRGSCTRAQCRGQGTCNVAQCKGGG